MKTLHVKRLFTKYGEKEYVFYEFGKYATPLFILSEEFTKKFAEELNNLIDDKDFIVKQWKGCKEE